MQDGKKIVFLDVTTEYTRKKITENVPEGFQLVLAEASTEDKAIEAVKDADFILVGSSYVPTKVVEAAKKAKLIQKMGEGTDRIDVVTATSRGILVAKTTGTNSNAVAEYATLLMLAALRSLPKAHNSVVAGQWLKHEMKNGSYELRGRQVGIVGLGKIGKFVAKQVQGFGATAVYYDIFRQPEAEEARLDIRYMPLDELLRTSDIVTLHVPGSPSTRGMIGERELSLMKPTAILINTCRGVVVDEEALIKALKERRIRGAGIDVFTKEPPDRNHLFFSLDNVVLAPHAGGGTEEAYIAGIRHAYANIVKVSKGEPLDKADLAPLAK